MKHLKRRKLEEIMRITHRQWDQNKSVWKITQPVSVCLPNAGLSSPRRRSNFKKILAAHVFPFHYYSISQFWLRQCGLWQNLILYVWFFCRGPASFSQGHHFCYMCVPLLNSSFFIKITKMNHKLGSFIQLLRMCNVPTAL